MYNQVVSNLIFKEKKMNDFAKAQVVGRLARDPMKFGEGNSRCAVFTVAVNRPGKDGTKHTTYLPAIAWGDTSDTFNGMTKGTRVNVTGSLEFHKSPKRDTGELRLRVETVVLAEDREDKVKVSATESNDASSEELF